MIVVALLFLLWAHVVVIVFGVVGVVGVASALRAAVVVAICAVGWRCWSSMLDYYVEDTIKVLTLSLLKLSLLWMKQQVFVAAAAATLRFVVAVAFLLIVCSRCSRWSL